MEFTRTAEIASRLEVLAHTGSTNADLRRRAADAENHPHLSVLLTRDQRAGRGRLDRGWHAPAGTALAVSVLLRDTGVPAARRGWIPLIAGAAMAEAVAAQLPGHEVGVKWPNDVLVTGAGKICGILAEAVNDDAVIVGSGVNTGMTAAQLPVPTATSFAALGAECDEDLLVSGYLRRLDDLLAMLASEPDAVHAVVSSRCVTLGQRVRVSLPDGGELRGRAVELADDGRLVVDENGTGHAIGAGDVVHVRPADTPAS